MTVKPGDEFRIKATPDQELLRKLSYLAAQDNDSVTTGGLGAPRTLHDGGRKARRADGFADALQMLGIEQQRRAEQIRLMNERLTELERASAKALRDAEDRLAEITRTANRTADGRLVFADETGALRDEQGGIVDPEEVDRATWNEDAASWETYRDVVEDRDQAAAYRDRVQEHKARLADDPSDDELADLEAELDALEADMPEGVAAVYQAPAAEAAAARPTSAAKLYADDPGGYGEAALRTPFAGAATDAPAAPDAPAEPGVKPDSPFTPS